uniref:Carboxylic ester hydrolase n=1 Tax=Dactylellina cionopaga TaxID=47266 RepID=G3FEI9_9PEZI|nr:carboxylesterase [Dactylellina cionopaga]
MRLTTIIFAALAVAQASEEVAGFPSTSSALSSPQVDLGYAVYQGSRNVTSGLDTYFGIRYAVPPTGSSRFKEPQSPTIVGKKLTVRATTIPPRCPQACPAPYQGTSGPGLTNSPINTTAVNADPYFQALINGNEDCLFLNVYAPSRKQNLPVLVWIHGGGYGFGDGSQDPTATIKENGNTFIGVSIQYRLGAFGFLSSQDVKNYGVPNAGILDQNLALQWVQKNIKLFGGDPNKVTISGNSAGGGSVMLHIIAHGGGLGTNLFQNSISTSPYSPPQYNYNAPKPTKDYLAFAQLAGCYDGSSVTISSLIVNCLRGKDTTTLQQANAVVSASGIIGTWAFVPVTDGKYIQQLPSRQLASGKLNGKRHLSVHNAEEGALFVQSGITDPNSFKSYIKLLFPSLSSADVSKVLSLFSPSSSKSGSLFPTLGDIGPTALNQGAFATGYQQAAYNLYAEATFICPSYWLADAFSKKQDGGYKYQYSVVPAMHTTDVAGYFGPIGGVPNLSPEFQRAFMRIWGNFITSCVSPVPELPTPREFSLPWKAYIINLNQTGGVPGTTPIPPVGAPYPANVQPGLKNEFTLENGYTWEGGRGERCEFWRSIASKVPQ